jgi:hypothetical protein
VFLPTDGPFPLNPQETREALILFAWLYGRSVDQYKATLEGWHKAGPSALEYPLVKRDYEKIQRLSELIKKGFEITK